jgi:hypothetical protein
MTQGKRACPWRSVGRWRADQQIVRFEGDLPAGLMIRHPRSAAASPGSRDIRGTRSHAQGREPGQLRRPGQADGPRHIEVNWLHRDALSLPTCGTEPSDLLEWPAGRQAVEGELPRWRYAPASGPVARAGPRSSAARDLATDIPVYATDILAYFPRPYLP